MSLTTEKPVYPRKGLDVTRLAGAHARDLWHAEEVYGVDLDATAAWISPEEFAERYIDKDTVDEVLEAARAWVAEVHGFDYITPRDRRLIEAVKRLEVNGG